MNSILIPTAALLFAANAAAQPSGAPVQGVLRPTVTPRLSRPLRDIPPKPPTDGEKKLIRNEETPFPRANNGPEKPDPVLQTAPGVNAPTPTGVSFDGAGVGLGNFAPSSAPPDTNGRVGPNNFVEWINTSFAVWDKAGNLLYGPAAGNTLWSGFGGDCETHNDGDPVAQYDLLADRWILNQFVVGGSGGFSHQCIAVTQTGDPTGAWYLYDFVTDETNFVDYPKLAVWPDGYYMSGHIFPASGSGYVGQGLYVFDRESMLAGLPAAMLAANLGNIYFGGLPSDLDSLTPPPAGSPNTFVSLDTNSLDVWQAAVSWGGSPTLTVTGPTIVATAAFNPTICLGRNCVPQPPPAVTTSDGLDVISDRLMYRLAYRNFGDHEALVLNHTVKVGSGATAHSGVRWYELRSPGTTPTIFQQGTYSPDNTWRWMGSIAMDNSGDVALGYSMSSASLFPSDGVTGRLVSDAAGTMGSETTVQSGSGVQQGTGNRWGDYSAMTVDPVDGCTFWFAGEYIKTTGSFEWSTRIAALAFPSCTAPQSGTLQGVVTDCSTGVPIGNALVELDNGFSAATDNSGNYKITAPPGSFTVTAAAAGRLCTTSAGVGVSITNGGNTVQDFCLTGTPKLDLQSLAIDDSTGNNNGIVNADECVRLNVVLSNDGCAGDTGISATVSTTTAGVNISQNASNYPDIAVNGNAANATPFQFATIPSFVCGTPIAFTLTITSANGTHAVGFSVPTCGGGSDQTFSGNIALTDPSQSNRIGRDGTPSICSPPKTCPGGINTAGTRNYDTYTFQNTALAPACITVAVNAACGSAVDISSTAYLGSYNPANLCANYLGDSGIVGLGNTIPSGAYSFEVPAASTFVVAVYTNAGSTTCAAYSGTVSGFYDFTPGPGPCNGTCPPIALLPASLPPGGAGTGYNQTVTASGGASPYGYAVTSGALPAGLSLDASTGAITGAPTGSGPFPFTITATDFNGCTGSQSYSIDVNPTGQVLKFFTIPPCRLVDTRKSAGTYGGPALAGDGAQRTFPIAGQCGVPADAMAVSVNLTAVGPTGKGDLRLFPTGTATPGASAINFNAGITRANNAILSLTGSPLGSSTVQCDITGGSTNLLLDINGYFEFVSP